MRLYTTTGAWGHHGYFLLYRVRRGWVRQDVGSTKTSLQSACILPLLGGMVYIASQKLIRYEFSFSSSLVSRRQFSVYSDKDLRGCQTQLVRLRCSVLAQPPQDVLWHALASVGALSLSNPYSILLWLPRVLRWYSQTSRTFDSASACGVIWILLNRAQGRAPRKCIHNGYDVSSHQNEQLQRPSLHCKLLA